MTSLPQADGLIQYLLSLPPQMAAGFARLTGRMEPTWFATSDPPGSQLGSGGGTAHLLHAAWRATGGGRDFATWLRGSRKLLVHGGGESRRLPAYAALGKPLMPIPALRWSRGQRLDQTLLDLQLPGYQHTLAAAPEGFVALVTSGDVLLRFGRELPTLPAVDVLGFGMWVRPETAKDHGVFFVPRARPHELAFFLQKPAPARLRELAVDHACLVDTGMWLLSARAVEVLFERCGWEAGRGEFRGGAPERYDLYGDFGLSLGSQPTRPEPLIGSLTSAVVPLPRPEFYHFGTSRQLIESVSALMNLELDETKLGLMGARRHPDQYLQNARFGFPLRRDDNHTLWVENATVPRTWHLAHEHVLTGIPENEWDLHLEPGVCLDFVPVTDGPDAWCLRCYGMDDRFRGTLEDPGTTWLQAPAVEWFRARQLDPAAAGIDPGTDLQDAALFPVLDRGGWEPRFIEWLFRRQPATDPVRARRWLEAPRRSARDLARTADLIRQQAHREANRDTCLAPMLANRQWSVFLKLDLEATSKLYARTPAPLPPAEASSPLEPMQVVHEEMFRAAVSRKRGTPGWETHERRAFQRLREMLVHEAELAPARPRCTLIEDQIVWGRSPVRLDLAGGWTDTPPYCLEFGGRVVNLAVNLNGQPPIQAFARLSPTPELVMRSIDLGVEQRVRTYDELDTFAQPGSEFAIAKAALALAGFLPRFHADGGSSTLEGQLREFGGGIEISLLCAVPKGSGLGTSSILAATVLATLGDLCGLGWDRGTLFQRTLALEQLLTTGGGWQDQAGGIYRGVKLVETEPGLKQRPLLRWLPEHLFADARANDTVLLYYTGITRLAASLLQEIVRQIFLNSAPHLETLEEIGATALAAFQAIQTEDYATLTHAVGRSWTLNQRLDAGTNPPAIQGILDRVGDWLGAAKLLGAGGGGYLLMLAKDPEAARHVRETLTLHPPNARARFVTLALSDTGLELTRS